MNCREEESRLVGSLSIALGRDVSAIPHEDLLDLIEEKLKYAGAQRHLRNNEEARYTESIAGEIKDLLKLKMKRLESGSGLGSV